MIEEGINLMMKNINLFDVVYKRDKFILDGKEFPIGYLSYLALKSECNSMDITPFKDLNDYSETLIRDFTIKNLDLYHQKILSVFNQMKPLPIFSLFDLNKRIEKLSAHFSPERKQCYLEIYQMLHVGYDLDSMEKANRADELMRLYDDFFTLLSVSKILYSSTQELINYAAVVFQITQRIVKRGARTKSQLADAFGDFLADPIMQFIFHTDRQPFRTKASVIPVIENVDGENNIFRKVFYNSLQDFLYTDLFEGYIHGHYLWRCDICDNYFFMTTAHNQLYCSTVNPKYGVPCSYVAKHPEITKRLLPKQSKTNSPYYITWKKRADSIRKKKSLGKYDETVSAKAKKYIDDCFERARIDFDYAERQYEDDMEIDNIYREAMKNIDV